MCQQGEIPPGDTPLLHDFSLRTFPFFIESHRVTMAIVDARPAMASTIVDARPQRVKGLVWRGHDA